MLWVHYTSLFHFILLFRFSRSLKVENGKRKKSHPVLLMPEEDPNPPWKCSPSNAMSSIGFMAFVISVVNAVISAVNNGKNNTLLYLRR